MPARLSLKDQLAELDKPAPIDLDPEDVLAGGDSLEHRLSIHHPSATEHYIDVSASSLRKPHESVNDPKYNSTRTSRKQLNQDSDEESADADESQDDDPSEHDGFGLDVEHLNESEGDSDDDENTISSPITEEGLAPNSSEIDVNKSLPSAQAPEDSPLQGDIAFRLRQTHEADKKKGNAISRQMALWDTLLDTRIQLQKAVTAANSLRLVGDRERYAAEQAAHEAVDSLMDVAGSLTEELFSLQEDLLRLNEQIDAPARKRRKVGTASDGVGEHGEMLRELCGSASALEGRYHEWVVDTLSKWSGKVQAVAPNVLVPSNRGSFTRDGKGSQTGVVGVIDEVLGTEGTKMAKRTHRRKDQQMGIGEQGGTRSEGDEEMDGEVFDDTEYYQQLLRDVIGARGGGMGERGEEEWQRGQRERKARRQKEVDTRASKGRKVRYDVHAKLASFMVPVPAGGADWHDEQIDGLFSSLLAS